MSLLSTFGVLLVLYLILNWLIYLARTSPDKATYTKGTAREIVNTTDLLNGHYDQNLVRMNEYAELSDIVYRRKEKENVVAFLNWQKLPLPMIPTDPDDESKRKLEGLYYEIWGLEDSADENKSMANQ